jgi:hypothetical protein
MRAVYISLPQHAERRAALLPQLHAAGLGGAEHFEAVDGRANPLLTTALLHTRLITPHAANTLTPGQKGCLASHAGVWQQAVWRARKLDDWLFVFEDDVRFHPLCTPDELARRLGTLPLDARFLKLAYLCDGPFMSSLHPFNSDWHALRGPTFSTVAYAVRVDALPALLRHTWNSPVDCELPFGDGVYGATSFDSTAFYTYSNPLLQRDELFHGVCSVARETTSTTAPAIPRLHAPPGPRDHSPPGPRDHSPPGPRDHSPPGPRDHSPPGPRDHSPPGPRDHSPPGTRDHSPPGSRDHSPPGPRDHSPPGPRDHSPPGPRS